MFPLDTVLGPGQRDFMIRAISMSSDVEICTESSLRSGWEMCVLLLTLTSLG